MHFGNESKLYNDFEIWAKKHTYYSHFILGYLIILFHIEMNMYDFVINISWFKYNLYCSIMYILCEFSDLSDFQFHE